MNDQKAVQIIAGLRDADVDRLYTMDFYNTMDEIALNHGQNEDNRFKLYDVARDFALTIITKEELSKEITSTIQIEETKAIAIAGDIVSKILVNRESPPTPTPKAASRKSLKDRLNSELKNKKDEKI